MRYVAALVAAAGASLIGLATLQQAPIPTTNTSNNASVITAPAIPVTHSLKDLPKKSRPTPVKATRSHIRRAITHHRIVRPRFVARPGAEQWAHGSFALRVTHCEAPDGPVELDNNGGVYYFGKWQMNEDFVRTYGHVNPWLYVSGGKFTMPEAMQDEIAYRGYLARGWQPWACASMV